MLFDAPQDKPHRGFAALAPLEHSPVHTGGQVEPGISVSLAGRSMERGIHGCHYGAIAFGDLLFIAHPRFLGQVFCPSTITYLLGQGSEALYWRRMACHLAP